MNEHDLLFRCHCLSDFASTSAEENKNPYFATLKSIEKVQSELETLKQAKAIEARKELLIELNAKLEEYEPFKDKVYLSKTAHKRILKMAREIKYGIRENLENKYVLKGLMNEEDAISLWSYVSGKFLTKKWRGLEGKLQKLADKAAISEEAYFLLKMGDLFRENGKTNVPMEHRNHLILIQEVYLDFYEEERGSLKLFFDEVAKGIGS